MITITRPMTPEQFAAKAAQLKTEQGIVLEGTQGSVSKDGVAGKWGYDGTTLTVAIGTKPFFATWSLVQSKLEGWLDS